MNLNRERDQRALRREHERERAEAAAETARLLVQQGTTPEVIVEDNAPTEPSHHDISQGDDPVAETDLEEEFEQHERRPAGYKGINRNEQGTTTVDQEGLNALPQNALVDEPEQVQEEQGGTHPPTEPTQPEVAQPVVGEVLRCDRAVKGAALFALKKRPARGALKIQMLSYGEAVLFYFVDLDDVILCCKTHYGQESAAQTFFPI